MVTTEAKPGSVKGGKKAKQAKRTISKNTRAKKAELISTREPSGIEAAITDSAALAISNDQRLDMIQTAAWLRAEKRGFNGDNSMDDWLMAEAEIDAMLSVDKQNTPLL